MYEINDEYPSPEDLKLLANLDDKGRVLIDDLFKVFSYRKPKEYKLYVDRFDYTPKDDEKEKAIMDLILIIKKYNQILSKKMAYYEEKKKENKFFAFLYEGMKFFNSDLCGKKANSSMNLLGTLINKYEKKHLTFDSKFLTRNIFNKSGLLPLTQKQTLEFFDSEIQKNGPNSKKYLKSIKFIERLYEIVSKMSKRIAISNTSMKILNQMKMREKRAEYLAILNRYKLHKKEIHDDMEEIKKIKELINIANNNYERILNELSKSKSKKKKVKIKRKKNKSKSKSKSKSKIDETEENKDIINEESININKSKDKSLEKNENKAINPNDIKNNFVKISRDEEKENKNKFFKLKKIHSLERYNKTSLDAFKGLNLLNNRMTASTSFNDFNRTLSKNNTFYNPNMNKLNFLNKINLNLGNDSTKKLKFQQKGGFKNVTRNDKKFFTNLRNNNLINIIDNMNKTSSHIFQSNKVKKTKSDYPSIIPNNKPQIISTKNTNKNLLQKDILENKNLKDIKENINNEKSNYNNGENAPIRKLVKRKTNLKIKREKKIDKVELYYKRKQKIPAIYEELKSYKNILSIAKKNNSQSMRIEQLFSQLYDKKRIKNINGQKAPKELYNSYYNMKESIERCHAPETIYRKYKNNMGDSLKKKIGKSNDQDDELKNKYFDFMQMIIKKKIEDDENEL